MVYTHWKTQRFSSTPMKRNLRTLIYTQTVGTTLKNTTVNSADSRIGPGKKPLSLSVHIARWFLLYQVANSLSNWPNHNFCCQMLLNRSLASEEDIFVLKIWQSDCQQTLSSLNPLDWFLFLSIETSVMRSIYNPCSSSGNAWIPSVKDLCNMSWVLWGMTNVCFWPCGPPSGRDARSDHFPRSWFTILLPSSSHFQTICIFLWSQYPCWTVQSYNFGCRYVMVRYSKLKMLRTKARKCSSIPNSIKALVTRTKEVFLASKWSSGWKRL